MPSGGATPVYSHGGPAMPGWPAVNGTTTNSGNPVYILQAQVDPAMQIYFVGTSCTVLIEGNGKECDPVTGQPPANGWFDYSSGGYSLTTGQNLSKFLPRSVPCWRTRITAMVLGGGTGLESYVPCIISPRDGVVVSASRPPVSSAMQT